MCHQYELKDAEFIEPLHKPEDDIVPEDESDGKEPEFTAEEQDGSTGQQQDEISADDILNSKVSSTDVAPSSETAVEESPEGEAIDSDILLNGLIPDDSGEVPGEKKKNPAPRKKKSSDNNEATEDSSSEDEKDNEPTLF